MNKRTYENYCVSNGIQDVLGDLEDFSFTNKAKVVKLAIKEGDKKSANQALAYYKSRYIDTDSVNYRTIYNIVRGMSKFYFNKFNNEVNE